MDEHPTQDEHPTHMPAGAGEPIEAPLPPGPFDHGRRRAAFATHGLAPHALPR